jgi:hypothetical protein
MSPVHTNGMIWRRASAASSAATPGNTVGKQFGRRERHGDCPVSARWMFGGVPPLNC